MQSKAGLFMLAACMIAAPAFALSNAQVERIDGGHVRVSWTDPRPVRISAVTSPVVTPLAARTDVIATNSAILPAAAETRTFFLLRDSDGRVTRVAERVLPLTQASNFRDVGGYPAAGGKHVRWGMIYRAGATPLLSDADEAQIATLGLKDMVDLRSSEERALAPSRIEGTRYSAYGYSFVAMMKQVPTYPQAPASYSGFYRVMPSFLAPQLRIIFAKLLQHDGPIAYNCSAGQDRTGFTTAMVLSALGTPRATIYQDYLLSTQYRHPEFEMPRIDAATAAANPAAAMFAAFQKNPELARPKPLVDANGAPLLTAAFAEIEQHWGSVDNYLTHEIGLSAADRAALRRLYLE